MASNPTGDWQEQLVALRGLTALTGALHEAQLLQLKMWGALAFPHVPKGQWEVWVDPDQKTVTYALNPLKKVASPPRGRLIKLIASLDRMVHWLLGDDWGLHLSQHGKAIYQGHKQETAEKVHDQRKSRAARRANGSRPR